ISTSAGAATTVAPGMLRIRGTLPYFLSSLWYPSRVQGRANTQSRSRSTDAGIPMGRMRLTEFTRVLSLLRRRSSMIGLFLKYFVLNPTKNDSHGRASRAAIQTYADWIGRENKQFSDELVAWIDKLEEEEE
ncbi:hypothetical protein LCGC14_2505750, partial [marine sediment metagenome]